MNNLKPPKVPNWIAALIIGSFLSLIYLAAINSSEATASTQRQTSACNAEISCWAKKHLLEARACTSVIERSIGYEFKWTEGLLESKYTNFRWHNKAAYTITYSGDSLLVQNANGAFVRTVYECDFDPVGESVLGARIWPGRVG